MVACSPLPSFQGRPSSLCVSDFPHTSDGALLCVGPCARPRGWGGGLLPGSHAPRHMPGQGARALYHPEGCSAGLELGATSRAQLSVDLLLLVFSTTLEFVLASGSFLSADSAPPPPGYGRMFWEGSRTPVPRGGRPFPPTWLLRPSQQLLMKNTFILKNIMKNRKTFPPPIMPNIQRRFLSIMGERFGP